MIKTHRLENFEKLLKKAQSKYGFEILEKPREEGALGFSIKVKNYKVISSTLLQNITVGIFFKKSEAEKVKTVIEKCSARRYKEGFRVKIVFVEFPLRRFHLEQMIGI